MKPQNNLTQIAFGLLFSSVLMHSGIGAELNKNQNEQQNVIPEPTNPSEQKKLDDLQSIFKTIPPHEPVYQAAVDKLSSLLDAKLPDNQPRLNFIVYVLNNFDPALYPSLKPLYKKALEGLSSLLDVRLPDGQPRLDVVEAGLRHTDFLNDEDNLVYKKAMSLLESMKDLKGPDGQPREDVQEVLKTYGPQSLK